MNVNRTKKEGKNRRKRIGSIHEKIPYNKRGWLRLLGVVGLNQSAFVCYSFKELSYAFDRCCCVVACVRYVGVSVDDFRCLSCCVFVPVDFVLAL